MREADRKQRELRAEEHTKEHDLGRALAGDSAPEGAIESGYGVPEGIPPIRSGIFSVNLFSCVYFAHGAGSVAPFSSEPLAAETTAVRTRLERTHQGEF